MNRLKITHVIGSLVVGGAERALCSLLARIDRSAVDLNVISILPPGPLAKTLVDIGIRPQFVGVKSSSPNPWIVVKLARMLRRHRPDVLVTWMYHSNLIGGLAARFVGRIPVVWNIRHTELYPDHSKRMTRLVATAGTLMSRWLPQRIAFVSHAGQKAHLAQGYPADRSVVIPNGFDLEEFCPDATARDSLRRELSLPADAPLVGLVGRFHADKDQANFIRASAILRRQRPDVHLLLCGDGIDWSNPSLARWIDDAGIRTACHLLGRRDDMHRIAATLDLNVSSSATEAFSRAVGESMASAVPCVVTDVGDSAYVVGDTGWVVPPRDPESLASACLAALALSPAARKELGRKARQRIATHFSVRTVVPRYLQLWTSVAHGDPMAVEEPMPVAARAA